MLSGAAEASRQRVGSFRGRLKKQQPIMMYESGTFSPDTLLKQQHSQPPQISTTTSVDYPCNVAVTVHEFIDSNQEICDL